MEYIFYLLLLLLLFLLSKIIFSRFINPLNLTLISILYYSLPVIYVLLFIDSLESNISYNSDNKLIAFYCLLILIVSIISISIGFLLATKIKTNISSTYLYFEIKKNKFTALKYFYYLFFILIFFGIILYGPSILFSGYNVQSTNNNSSLGTALLFGSLEYFGVLFSFSFIYKIMYGTLPLKKYFILSILILIFFAIIRGKRLEVVSAILPIIFLNFAFSEKFKKKSNKIILSFLILITISFIAIFRTGGQLSINSLLYNIVSEGFLAGLMLPSLMNLYLINQMFYEYGGRVVLSLFSIFPSLFWPNKNDFIVKFNENFEGLTPFGAVSYISEIFVQGGFFFLIIYFIFFGAFIGYIFKLRAHVDNDMNKKRISIRLIMYLNFLTYTVPHFRDGIIVSNKSFIQSTLFFLLLLFLNSKLYKKNENIYNNCN